MFLSLTPVWHQGLALVWHQFGTMQTVAKPCNGALLQLSTPLPALADRQRPPLPADRPSPPAAHPPSADRCRCCPSRAAVTSCPGWWPAHTQTLHPAGHSGQVALEKGGYVRRRHTLSHPLANQVVLVGPHMGVANRANRHPGADTPEQTLSAAVMLPWPKTFLQSGHHKTPVVPLMMIYYDKTSSSRLMEFILPVGKQIR